MPTTARTHGVQNLVSNHYVRVVLEHLRDVESVDIDRFLADHNIAKPDVVSDQDMLPAASYLMLLEEGALHVKDPCLGLHIYERIDFVEFSAYGYAMITSPTLRKAVETGIRYYSLNQTNASYSLTTEGKQAEIAHEFVAIDLPYSRQDREICLYGAVKLIRRFAGDDWQPDVVHLLHSAPADPTEHHRLLGSRLQFNQPHAKVVFDADLLDLTQETDQRLNDSLIEVMESNLQAITPLRENRWLTRVQEEIVRSLPGSEHDIDTVASRLGMSSRTLQRKLQREGMGYRDVLSRVRRQLANHYLSDSELSMQDISFMLGYSDLSSFDRAFKGWDGRTPMEYRLRHRQRVRGAQPI